MEEEGQTNGSSPVYVLLKVNSVYSARNDILQSIHPVLLEYLMSEENLDPANIMVIFQCYNGKNKTKFTDGTNNALNDDLIKRARFSPYRYETNVNGAYTMSKIVPLIRPKPEFYNSQETK